MAICCINLNFLDKTFVSLIEQLLSSDFENCSPRVYLKLVKCALEVVCFLSKLYFYHNSLAHLLEKETSVSR